METNRFDQETATWDESPRRVRLAKAVAEAIDRAVPLSREMNALDYGCGTGLLTLNLLPKVARITGADPSSGMLEVFRRKILEQNVEAVHTIHLRQEDLWRESGPYDLIASSMTLHHVEDPAALIGAFRSGMTPGGWLALADLDTEDGTFHAAEVSDVFYHGFDRTWLCACLAEAGFSDVSTRTAFEVRRNGRDYPIFLITGRAGG